MKKIENNLNIMTRKATKMNVSAACEAQKTKAAAVGFPPDQINTSTSAFRHELEEIKEINTKFCVKKG